MLFGVGPGRCTAEDYAVAEATLRPIRPARASNKAEAVAPALDAMLGAAPREMSAIRPQCDKLTRANLSTHKPAVGEWVGPLIKTRFSLCPLCTRSGRTPRRSDSDDFLGALDYCRRRCAPPPALDLSRRSLRVGLLSTRLPTSKQTCLEAETWVSPLWPWRCR